MTSFLLDLALFSFLLLLLSLIVLIMDLNEARKNKKPWNNKKVLIAPIIAATMMIAGLVLETGSNLQTAANWFSLAWAKVVVYLAANWWVYLVTTVPLAGYFLGRWLSSKPQTNDSPEH